MRKWVSCLLWASGKADLPPWGGDGNQLRLPLALRVKLPHSWDRGQRTRHLRRMRFPGWKYMDQLLYEGVVEFWGSKIKVNARTTNVDDGNSDT